MTCQECELKLGINEDARDHLAECAECRWLAKEMGLNALALRGMRERRSWIVCAWMVAAAAAVVVIAIGLGVRKEKKAGESPALQVKRNVVVAQVAEAVPVKIVKKKHRAGRRLEPPLKVKMFTSDPDVVIYWIVDRKDGVE